MSATSPWPTVPLGEVCDFLSGCAFKSAQFNNDEEGLPLIRVRDVQRGYSKTYLSGEYDAKFLIEDGDLLVGMDGDFNCSLWSGGSALLNQRVCRLDAREEILDRSFLFRVLPMLLAEIHRRTPFVTVKHLSMKKLTSAPLPLPPIAEQRRIAAVLDEADSLRKKRAESLTKLDDLKQSIFISMFGDLAINDRGWPEVSADQFVSGFETGVSLTLKDGERASKTKVLKISAVTSGRFAEEEAKAISATHKPLEKHFVKRGDLLMSRANTTELVGAVAYVFEEPSSRLLPDKLWRFQWAEKLETDPLFIAYAMRSRKIRHQIETKSTGSSGSMKNISQRRFMELRFPLPPAEEQKRFGEIIRELELENTTRLRRSQTHLDTLFASLQQKAFAGRL